MSEAAETPRRIVCHEVIRSISVVAPAVRVLVVQAWAWVDEGGTLRSDAEAYPALALQVSVVDAYSRRAEPDERVPAPRDHDQAMALGLSFDCTFLKHELIVHDGDIICAPDDMEASNTVSREVVAPWPPSEDAERLAPLIAELIEKARLKPYKNPFPKPQAPSNGGES